MSVWLTIPSARPAEKVRACLTSWKERGYQTAVLRDIVDVNPSIDADHTLFTESTFGRYPGYAIATNRLIRAVMELDPGAEWFVCGGDDTFPNLTHTAEQIARACTAHFGGTFGVMQPTGDRYAGGCIDRIAGSPWIGREFARRTYRGNGPYWTEYTHMFVDEEIMCVAEKLGVYWRRPDLVHLHRHFMRKSDAIDSPVVRRPVPAHLVEANSPGHWRKFKALFEARRAAAFPGHEVIT